MSSYISHETGHFIIQPLLFSSTHKILQNPKKVHHFPFTDSCNVPNIPPSFQLQGIGRDRKSLLYPLHVNPCRYFKIDPIQNYPMTFYYLFSSLHSCVSFLIRLTSFPGYYLYVMYKYYIFSYLAFPSTSTHTHTPQREVP